MINLKPIFIACASLLLCACASHSPKSVRSQTTPLQKSAALLEMEQKRRSLEEKKQDQKDQDKLLKRKNDMQGIFARVNPQEKKIRLDLDSAKSANLDEAQLYAELVSRFERNDEIGFQSRFQMMMSKYAKSSLADDALYLAGLQQVGLKNYGLALKYFNQIAKDYPYSNKAVSALFAKGAVYRKMNLDFLAKDQFKAVLNRYPGSPESFRAQNELRLLN